MQAKRKLIKLWMASLIAGTAVIGSGIALRLSESGALTTIARAAADSPGETALADDDWDGIPNIADNSYYRMGRDDPDSDGDGYPDGFEIGTGSDPGDPMATPMAPFTGTAVLIAPDGPDVYLVFVSASANLFSDVASSTANIVKHTPNGVIHASLPVGPAFLNRVTKLRSSDGSVVSFSLRVPRSSIGRWSVGFGMRDTANNVYCNDVFVHRRVNGNVYAITFTDDSSQRTALETVEPETPSSSGFKECVQTSVSGRNSSIRHIVNERCETRDLYECVADCGALTGATVIRLNQQWMY